MNSGRSHRVVYLLLSFVFFSVAAIFALGFNILLALSTLAAAQVAFMILWIQPRTRKTDDFNPRPD